MSIVDYILLGTALSLFSVVLIGDNIKDIVGNGIKSFFKNHVSSPFKGGIYGFLFAAITTQSSLIRFLTRNFVSLGLFPLRVGIPVVLCASLGGVSLFFVVGFDFEAFLIPLTGIAGIFYAIGKPAKIKPCLGLLFGVGLLLYGMLLIKSGGKLIANEVWLKDYILASENQIITILISSLLFTLITQSPLGLAIILIALCKENVININVASALNYGIGLGSALNRFKYWWSYQGDAFRLLIVPIILRLFILHIFVISFLIEFYWKIPLVLHFLEWMAPGNLTNQIIFQILLTRSTVVLLPCFFNQQIVNLAYRWIPIKEEEGLNRAKYVTQKHTLNLDASVDLITMESNGLLARLPRYIEKPESLDSYHSGFLTINTCIRKFAQRINLNQFDKTASSSFIHSLERQYLIVDIELHVYKFLCLAKGINDPSKFLKEHINELKESVSKIVDATNLMLANPDEKTALLEITHKDSKFMQKIEKSYLNESGLKPKEQVLLFKMIMHFENTIKGYHELASYS
jgi:Na+/phosphate symporter